MTWQRKLVKSLNWMEYGYDRLKFAVMDTFGVRKPLRIHAYIGHGTPSSVIVKGRVLLENNVTEAQEDDSAWTNLVNMYRRFESDEIPYATVSATVGDTTEIVQCDEEGFFQAELDLDEPLPTDDIWQAVDLAVVETPIATLDTTTAETTAQVVVPPSNAQFGVISDLDDTVMKTDVLNLFKMLRNTVLHNAYARLPFDGVASFYRALQAGTRDTTNPIFYVSSSPWNLYDMIMAFYKIQDIPMGPLFLRDIGFAAHAVGRDYNNDHMGHKMRYINNVMDHHADLPFILIGDSGQHDVWVYEEAVRQYPGRVLAVYIRDVTLDDTRRAEIERVASRVKALGSEMLLVPDTYIAAEHAAQRGFIVGDQLPEIAVQCAYDAPMQ